MRNVLPPCLKGQLFCCYASRKIRRVGKNIGSAVAGSYRISFVSQNFCNTKCFLECKQRGFGVNQFIEETQISLKVIVNGTGRLHLPTTKLHLSSESPFAVELYGTQKFPLRNVYN